MGNAMENRKCESSSLGLTTNFIWTIMLQAIYICIFFAYSIKGLQTVNLRAKSNF